MKNIKKINIVLSILFLIVSVTGIYFSFKLPFIGNKTYMFSMKPSFYPTIIFSLLFLFSFILLVKSLSIKYYGKCDALLNRSIVIMFVLFLSYIFLLPFLRFILSTVIFLMFSSVFLLKVKTKRNIITLSIINVATSLGLYFLFVELLNVPI